MLELSIPRRMSHIWIGPLEPPLEWMQTWRDLHPDWEYRVYDNTYLENTSFRTHRQIEEYLKRGQYAGVADLMRYEILYEKGGYIAGADSICLHKVDELFVTGDLFTIYENEFLRGQFVSPIMASAPENEFLGILIDTLANTDPRTLDNPWKSTGNKFVAEMIEKHNPDIHIFPSHVFIPIHFEGRVYRGTEKVYAKQLFGQTRSVYTKTKKNTLQLLKENFARKSKAKYRRRALAQAKRLRGDLFDVDY